MIALRSEIVMFLNWAALASRQNTDWPTDYPGFGRLVDAAADAMRQAVADANVVDQDIEDIAKVWSVSEEPQSLQPVALELGRGGGRVLKRIYILGDRDARWQIADIADQVPELGIQFLLESVADSDSYVRRRAWFALARADQAIATKRAQAQLRYEHDSEVRSFLIALLQ